MNVASLAALLEGGTLDFPFATLLSKAWAALAAREIARPIHIPAGVELITVGGATLGGSGKTPLAIALARDMAARGHRVALVGHAFGARPGRARIVTPDDDVKEVGDEALVAARSLDGTGASVVVADDRANAVIFAATLARTLIVDGPLQSRPARAHRALLAVDAKAPWGSGGLPPRGDLRAPRAALLAACDIVVALGEERPEPNEIPFRPVVHVPTKLAPNARLHGAEPLSLASLATARLGLMLGLARPLRVVGSLERVGIRPLCTMRFRDHAWPPARLLDDAAILARDARLDAWLATEKCATRLPNHLGNVPVVTFAQELELMAPASLFLGLT